jgi:hypothetical protein
MNNTTNGLALSLNGWVEGHVGRDLSLKGQAKSLSDCSVAYILINNSLSASLSRK